MFVLTGCSNVNIGSGENIYLSSRNGPGLVMPKPLISYNISHFYDLPNQDGHLARNIDLSPP